MKRYTAAALVVCLVSIAQAQDMENPYKKAQVGDWVEYKVITSVGGKDIEAKAKVTVTAKDDKEATVSTKMTVLGMEVPAPDAKIDLTKPYDPTSTAGLPADSKAKVEKVGSGKEKIRVSGKEYDCTWIKMKIQADVKGINLNAEVTAWMSPSVPGSGMVKMQMTSQIFNMTMELTGSGKK